MTPTLPRLHGGRVLLRPLADDDLDALAEIVVGEGVRGHDGWHDGLLMDLLAEELR